MIRRLAFNTRKFGRRLTLAQPRQARRPAARIQRDLFIRGPQRALTRRAPKTVGKSGLFGLMGRIRSLFKKAIGRLPWGGFPNTPVKTPIKSLPPILKKPPVKSLPPIMKKPAPTPLALNGWVNRMPRVVTPGEAPVALTANVNIPANLEGRAEALVINGISYPITANAKGDLMARPAISEGVTKGHVRMVDGTLRPVTINVTTVF